MESNQNNPKSFPIFEALILVAIFLCIVILPGMALDFLFGEEMSYPARYFYHKIPTPLGFIIYLLIGFTIFVWLSRRVGGKVQLLHTTLYFFVAAMVLGVCSIGALFTRFDTLERTYSDGYTYNLVRWTPSLDGSYYLLYRCKLYIVVCDEVYKSKLMTGGWDDDNLIIRDSDGEISLTVKNGKVHSD